MADFRPVTLLPFFVRLIDRIGTSRLVAAGADRNLSVHSYGVRKGCQPYDVLLALQGLMSRAHEFQESGVIVRCDVWKAFDATEWGPMADALEATAPSARAEAARIVKYNAMATDRRP